MKKFQYNKLVRNKILENILKDENETPDYKKLSDGEYIKELKKKLIEEASEVTANNDPQSILKELADIDEVIDCLIKILGFKPKDRKNIKVSKNLKYGSFNKKYYIKSVELPEDSQWGKYLLSNPKNYPEIT